MLVEGANKQFLKRYFKSAKGNLYTDSDKMVFIAHGTDQVFHNTAMPVKPEMKGLMAQAVMEIPELRTRYLDRMRSLLTNVFVSVRHRTIPRPVPVFCAFLVNSPDGALKQTATGQT